MSRSKDSRAKRYRLNSPICFAEGNTLPRASFTQVRGKQEGGIPSLPSFCLLGKNDALHLHHCCPGLDKLQGQEVAEGRVGSDQQLPSHKTGKNLVFLWFAFSFFFFGGSNSSSEHSCRVNSENVLCFRLLTKLPCFITFISEQQNRAVHSTLISYQFYFLGLKTYSKFATFHSLDTIY